MITEDLLVSTGCCDAVMAKQWVEPLNQTCEKFGIDTPARVAGFLAQTAHESAGFKTLTENLNYSADGLANTWPNRYAKIGENNKYVRDANARYVPNDLAIRIQRQPERIANNAYANRMGNGDEASGDGWKYRGRGLIQLTGKDNYAGFTLECDNEALIYPELVGQTVLGAQAAGWFWRRNQVNQFCDAMDIEGMTRRVNGGTVGLAHRRQLWLKLCEALGLSPM